VERDESEGGIGRRQLLILLGAATAGAVALGLKLFQRSSGPWAEEVERGAALRPGESVEFSIGGDDALLRREPDGSFVAFDLTCTHKGCTVRWNAGREEFACPCHKGIYNRTGEVLEGPPKTPLQRLAVDTREGRVIVTKRIRIETN